MTREEIAAARATQLSIGHVKASAVLQRTLSLAFDRTSIREGRNAPQGT